MSAPMTPIRAAWPTCRAAPAGRGRRCRSCRVRRAAWGNRVRLHFLLNAQSGLCPEDCGYCSQSKISTAEIEKYPMMAQEKIMEMADRAALLAAFGYGLLGKGLDSLATPLEPLIAWYSTNPKLVLRTMEEFTELGVPLCILLAVWHTSSLAGMNDRDREGGRDGGSDFAPVDSRE